MLTFNYTATINALPIDDDKKFLETLTGEVSAENHTQAKQQASRLAFDHCRQLEQEQGGIIGYENVRVIWQAERQPVESMSADRLIALIYRHLEEARANAERAIEIHKQTKGRGKALTRSAVDWCSGRTMALQVLLNEIELGTGTRESRASEVEL